MEENREVILEYLLKVLQHTRAGSGVVRLELEEREDSDDAYVHVICYDDKHECEYEWLIVNITADSGIAMVRDICDMIH